MTYLARHRRRTSAAVLCVLVLSVVGLNIPPGNAGATSPSPDSTLAIPTPLSTSIQTAGGTWAAVPMGHLSQPLNTFWQLLYRPAGSASWSDQVEATATGTNGGLVLASPSAGTLDVGIRPSNLLTFSPLISTANNGLTWSNGLLFNGLASRPNALAAEGNNSLALVRSRDGEQVEESSTTLSVWHTLESERALASTSGGKTCGLTSMTAVGFLNGGALVGGACAHRGVVPLFVHEGLRWRLVQLVLRPEVSRGHVEVLEVQSSDTGTQALLGISNGSQIQLVDVWTSNTGNWRESKTLAVAKADHVISYGPTTSAGIFVLLSTPAGRDRLELFSDLSSNWEKLPRPPKKTSTIAFGPATQVEALSVNDTVLTVWRLSSDTDKWVRTQVMNVPILFGSAI